MKDEKGLIKVQIGQVEDIDDSPSPSPRDHTQSGSMISPSLPAVCALQET